MRTTPEAASPPAVLVIDKNQAEAALVVRNLAQNGYRVATAVSLHEAFDHIESQPFAAIVADLLAIRQSGDLRRAACASVALLASVDAGEVASVGAYLRDGSVDDYLVKPHDLGHAWARIGRVIAHRKIGAAAAPARKGLTPTLFRHFLKVLTEVLEAKDAGIYDRSARVSSLAAALAGRLRPDNAVFASKVRLAALFHDIGVIGIADTILHKPGRLSAFEQDQMRRHVEIGEKILQPLFENDEVVAIVRGHHEQWDGRGYPDGAAGSDIPLGARIIAVADAYDAMTSERLYRTALAPMHVLNVLKEGGGEQWDPLVVETLWALAAEGSLSNLQAGDSHEIACTIVAAAAAGPDSPPRRRPVLAASSALDAGQQQTLAGQVAGLTAGGHLQIVLDLSALGETLNHTEPPHRSAWSSLVRAVSALREQVEGGGGQLALRDAPSVLVDLLRQTNAAQSLLVEHSAIGRAAD